MKALLHSRARLLAGAFLLIGFLSCHSNTAKLLEDAEASWRSGRYLEALAGNRALYQREPKGRFAAQALLNLGNICYLNLRQLKPAIQYYDRLVSEFPESQEAVEAHRHLADIYADELNDKDQAIAHYDALLRDENLQDRMQILFQRGEMYFKKEDYDRALREMRTLEESPVDSRLADQISLKIGNIYQIRKEFDKAVEPYGKVIASQYPDLRRRAILSLAETYEMLFDFDNAVATLRKLDGTLENEQLIRSEIQRLKNKRSTVETGGAAYSRPGSRKKKQPDQDNP